MAAGDHLIARRLVYEHHGIDAGGGRVIHYHGDPSGKAIRQTTLEIFAKGRKLEVVPAQLGAPEALQRAQSRLGESSYGLFFNNCEHFARWAAGGRSRSFQVENVAMALVVLSVLAVSLVTGLLGALAREVAPVALWSVGAGCAIAHLILRRGARYAPLPTTSMESPNS